ncbi:molybdenum cofactor biosynthesis protein [Campylobacter jejuni]|nr:molybdenum cofactor biosynthesis protein [Campylobacter jejuni]EIM9392373.1 molybdenum cofactor biosynthesis protein [Campylobacter jejuni]
MYKKGLKNVFLKKKISQKQKEKPKIPINDVILDDRLYKFKNKIQKISKDEASVSLLARQLSRLVRANKF